MNRIKTGLQLFVVLIAGLLIGNATSAYGISGTNVYGCVGNNVPSSTLTLGNRVIPPNSILRVVGSSGDCNPNETPLNFSTAVPVVTIRHSQVMTGYNSSIVIANAMCLVNEKVLGGGFDTQIDYDNGYPLLIRFNKPVTNLVDESSNTVQGWSVAAQNPPTGWSSSVVVQAYAICST